MHCFLIRMVLVVGCQATKSMAECQHTLGALV